MPKTSPPCRHLVAADRRRLRSAMPRSRRGHDNTLAGRSHRESRWHGSVSERQDRRRIASRRVHSSSKIRTSHSGRQDPGVEKIGIIRHSGRKGTMRRRWRRPRGENAGATAVGKRSDRTTLNAPRPAGRQEMGWLAPTAAGPINALPDRAVARWFRCEVTRAFRPGQQAVGQGWFRVPGQGRVGLEG